MQDQLINQLIRKRYKITTQLEAGGMSTLYKAIDTSMDQEVVIKFLMDDEFKDVFREEISILRTVDHPNIQGFLASGRHLDSQYYVMPFYQHTNFRAYLDLRVSLLESSILDFFIQMCQAVSYLHERKILHNDLKPQNYLITKEQKLILVDFGLATRISKVRRIQRNKQVIYGSPVYLSPEVSLGKPPTFASDVYALGIILYILYLGFPPFYHAEVDTLLQHHQSTPPPAPHTLVESVSEEISRITLKAISKDPQRRYINASDLLLDIKTYQKKTELAKIKLIHRKPGKLSFDQQDTHPLVSQA